MKLNSKLSVSLIVSLAAYSSSATSVLTGPIVNPANGHSYYLLEQDTWTNSEAFAQTLGGHLVTINDAAENQWVFDTFANYDGVNRNLWIGLNDIAEEGTFVWANGEPLTFTKWALNPPQPDNAHDEQDVARIIATDDAFFAPRGGVSFWDDVSIDQVEFEGQPVFGVVEVIPEPASALLALGGLALLGCRRRVR